MQILAIAGLWLWLCALQPIPNQGAHTREDLLSVALNRQPEIGRQKIMTQKQELAQGVDLACPQSKVEEFGDGAVARTRRIESAGTPELSAASPDAGMPVAIQLARPGLIHRRRIKSCSAPQTREDMLHVLVGVERGQEGLHLLELLGDQTGRIDRVPGLVAELGRQDRETLRRQRPADQV